MRKLCCSVLCLLLLCGTVPAWALDISYTDANSDSDLKPVDGYNNVFYPPGSDTGNTVTVNFDSTSTFWPEHVFGAYAFFGHATGNEVKIEQGTISKSVIGGFAKSGDASGNKVLIKSGVEIHGTIHGGQSAKGSATGNEVTIFGKVKGRVTGGRATEDVANYNHVVLEGATLEDGVEGGRASNTTASDSVSYNTVTITKKSSVLGQVIGGYVAGGKGTASKNDVIVTDSAVDGLVAGGYIVSAQDGGKAETNTVTMTNSSASSAYGAYSYSGDTNTNKVKLTKTTVAMIVVGGFTQKGNAEDNTVIIEGGSVFGSVEGGSTEEGNVSLGTVELTGATVSQKVIGGRTLKGDVVNSSVKFDGGKAGDIIGGRSEGGNASGNKVQFDDGTADRVFGGWATDDASDNVVFINGGTVGDVYGGFNDNSNKAGSASGNTITITEGTVSRMYGGAAYHIDTVLSNNTVNWRGGDITAMLIVGGDKGENNTLNMYASGKKVMYLSGVQKYNFILPADTKKGAVILTVTEGGDTLGGPVTLKGATVNVGLKSGKDNVLDKGDKVTLIDSAKGFDTATPTKGEGLQDFDTIYDFDIAVEKGKGTQQLLVATVSGETPGPTPTPDPPKPDPKPGRKNPQLKALLEGALGSFALVGQGSEMVAGQGMNSAVRAAKAVAASGPVAFGSLGGSMSRYNTGSHVRVEGVNFLAGLGWQHYLNEGQNGSILAGVFFETGFGNYSAHNSFTSRPSVHGTGDTRYFGGGVLGRYTMPVGFYAEGSIRAGKVKNEYSAKDFISGAGERAEYDSSAAYVGAHGGLGYLWQFRESTSLDFSSKYLWTHQGSDTVKMGSSRMHLDSVNSHRWRTGARLTHEAVLRNGVVTSPYLGAAFDYEFGGKQKGTFKGTRRWNIDGPTLRGGTGMGEVGLTIKPSATSPVSFDFAVQGYAGKREGVSGNLNLRYDF